MLKEIIHRRRRLSSFQIIILGFALVILMGYNPLFFLNSTTIYRSCKHDSTIFSGLRKFKVIQTSFYARKLTIVIFTGNYFLL